MIPFMKFKFRWKVSLLRQGPCRRGPNLEPRLSGKEAAALPSAWVEPEGEERQERVGGSWTGAGSAATPLSS